MRRTPLACLRSGHHRQLSRGQISQQAERRHHPENLVVFAQPCPQARCQECKDGPRLWLVLGAHLFFTRAACYTPWPRDGDTILPRVTGLCSAPCGPLVGLGEWRHAPGVCGRRFRSRACGRRNPSGAPEGQQQGEGHTSVVAARAPGSTLRVVCPPRAWRRRHGDLPGQGAGHLPCRVSRPVSRRPVATGGDVGTVAASPAPRPGSSPARASAPCPHSRDGS